MQQKSKSKKHTQSIGGFLSPLWFPIPVPNPVWERFSFCFLFAFHLHFFRFFSKNGEKWKNVEKLENNAKKSQKMQIPLILHFFTFFCISPSVLAVFSKFDITFGTFPGSTTCISCVSFLLFAFLLLSLVAFFSFFICFYFASCFFSLWSVAFSVAFDLQVLCFFSIQKIIELG